MWRIASALMWAFADFDSVSVDADLKTMSPDDLKQLTEVAQFQTRSIQFGLLLSTLFGEDTMEKLMQSAILNARVTTTQSRRS